MAEFKRMRLSNNPDTDEHMIDVQYILDRVMEAVCAPKPSSLGNPLSTINSIL